MRQFCEEMAQAVEDSPNRYDRALVLTLHVHAIMPWLLGLECLLVVLSGELGWTPQNGEQESLRYIIPVICTYLALRCLASGQEPRWPSLIVFALNLGVLVIFVPFLICRWMQS